MERDDTIRSVKSPIVAPGMLVTDWFYPIIYSVTLENGWIATNPDAFPEIILEPEDAAGGGGKDTK